MTDHPLVPAEIKSYMEKHQVEHNLNLALNGVLGELPQDPFSSMAVILMDSNVVNAVIDRLQARETHVMDLTQPSLLIEVYLEYKGSVKCYAKHIHTYNLSDIDGNMTWDDPEVKTGMSKAAELINDQISPMLKGKDIMQFKKIEDQLRNFKLRHEEETQ